MTTPLRDDVFINPYTFIPLPDKIFRDETERRDHLQLAADGYSGSFDWVLTLQTPLLLPADQKAIRDGVLQYPGSSLRGALRALHEVLAGGCMRVLDEDYIPVHREPMNALKEGDELVVVKNLDPVTKRVTRVQRTERTIWIKDNCLGNLQEAPEGKDFAIYSGREFSLTMDSETEDRLDTGLRPEIRDSKCVQPLGTDESKWVLHVTDSGARDKKKGYFVAAGKLIDEYVEFDDISIWERFFDECIGSRDLIGVPKPVKPTCDYSPGTTDWAQKDEVTHPSGFKGRRRKVDGWLSVGDTVWLTSEGHLKMAAIWRRRGEVRVKDRLPSNTHLPCNKPTKLCPTCAVFGSVNTERSEKNEQAGYASHVTVGWGTSRKSKKEYNTDAPVRSRRVDTAPLRSPKPSSGGFYLSPPSEELRGASKAEDHIPRAHWGSEPDQTEAGPRTIRGRKQYWHGQVSDKIDTKQRQNKRHADNQNDSHHKVDVGTVIATRVTFENLSLEQVGWLFAAADPARFFSYLDGGTKRCSIHIGGGKPLGYGSAVCEIKNPSIENSASRYGATRQPEYANIKADAWTKIRQQIDQRGLSTTHNALKKALHPDAVQKERIWYPTSCNFDQRGSKDFDKSFKWFSDHSGGRFGDLVALPDILDDNQYLES